MATAKKTTSKSKTTIKKADNNEANFLGMPLYHEEKNEEYMNEKQLMHFKHVLEHWKKEILAEMEQTVNHMQEETANVLADPADNATREEEFALELRARDRELKLLKKIDKSIENIKHGDYGFCESCGVDIGIKRLEARPTATLCIDCKTIAEIKEKQYGE